MPSSSTKFSNPIDAIRKRAENGIMKLLICSLLLMPLLSCSVSKENDDLSLAQACLDNVSDSNPQAANSCMQYTDGYTDARANTLKCSIMLTAGGLTIDRMAQAYEVTQDS